jgi:hypothetical protein
VVLVSALDEELDQTDARFGIDVFWKAFLKNSRGYRMGVPSVPLAELYEGCRAAVEKKGGEVTLRSPVRGLCLRDGALAAVQFDGGREEAADAFVLAIPQDKLNELLPREIRAANPSLAPLEKFKVSPITGVHFWFDREVTKEPFITLLDTETQWIFNKTALYGSQASGAAAQPAVNSGQYLQLVISASYDLLRKSREEIIDLCLKEVRQALPDAREAQLVKATVVKEASATFRPEPGVDRWRPRSRPTRRASFSPATGPPPAGPPPWRAQSAAATSPPKPSSVPPALPRNSSCPTSRRPAFPALSRRTIELQTCQMPFPHGQWIALLVNLRILRRPLLPKLLIRLARLPAIHRHIHTLAPQIAEQSRPAIPRIAPEQPTHRPSGPYACSNNSSHPDLTSNSHRVKNKLSHLLHLGCWHSFDSET